MKVKCRHCGVQIEKKIAYKDPNKNFYYCNEEHYILAIKKKEKFAREKETKNKIYNIITEIFGYPIQNTYIYKEWSLWNKLADNEKILNFLCENKTYITGKINSLSSPEIARIKYFSAILKNSLKDYNNRDRVAQMPVIDDAMPRESSFVLFEPVKENKKVRKSFAELEDDL